MCDDWDDDAPSSGTHSYQPISAPATGGLTFGGRGRGFIPSENGRGGRGGFNRDGGDRGGRNFGDRPRRTEGDGGGRNFGRKNDDGGDRSNGDGFRGGRGDGGFKKKFGDDGENGETNGGEPEKPKAQTYIPPEINDSDLFENGVSTGQNFKKYDDIPVKVSGSDVPPPIKSFEESGLRKHLIEKVHKCNYSTPTPVQKHAIPIILKGRDVMGCAQTGSGKTAAFLLPIIHNLLAEVEECMEADVATPQAVVMSPTRELAIQIYQEARKFTMGTCITPCCVYGGTQVMHQVGKLRSGCHIIVATPGRLKDFIGRGRMSFHKIRFIVLDEADRMLDMGFKEDIEIMFNHETMVPKTERQTLMFSATFPDQIQKLAGQYLNNYLFIAVGIVGGACSDVEQRFIEISRPEKLQRVKEMVQEMDLGRTVIFVETKRLADFLAVTFSEGSIPTTSIHGDREQFQREEALRDFRNGTMRVLIATAVASRGLDIKNVDHVINYDMPKEIDEYVHRIGRTGRLGNRGLATSFYDDSGKDAHLAPDLVRILEQAGQEVPDFLVNASGGRSSGASHGNQGFLSHDTRKQGGGHQATTACAQVDDEAWD